MPSEARAESKHRDEDANSQQQVSLQEAKNPEIDSSIRSLEEEARQMVELVEMEKNYTTEVVAQFKQIIEFLGVPYHIQVSWPSKSDSMINDIVLTPQGVLCVNYSTGAVASRPLEAIAGETLLKVINEAIPQVKRAMVEKRQTMSLRVNLLERVSRELGKVSAAADGETEQQPPRRQK